GVGGGGWFVEDGVGGCGGRTGFVGGGQLVAFAVVGGGEGGAVGVGECGGPAFGGVVDAGGVAVGVEGVGDESLDVEGVAGAAAGGVGEPVGGVGATVGG
ncbi:PE family protein, partial [Corynebacterium macclintockiae]